MALIDMARAATVKVVVVAKKAMAKAEVAGRFALQVDTMETRAVVARAAGAKLEAAMVMG